jgi:hypothetical protein
MIFTESEIKEYLEAMEIITASCDEKIGGLYLSMLVNALIGDE